MIIPGHANSCYFGKRDVINHKHATDASARDYLAFPFETMSTTTCMLFSVFLPQHTLQAESPSILSLLPLPNFSRKIEGDSARNVITAQIFLFCDICVWPLRSALKDTS